jgi:hypothetical protein
MTRAFFGLFAITLGAVAAAQEAAKLEMRIFDVSALVEPTADAPPSLWMLPIARAYAQERGERKSGESEAVRPMEANDIAGLLRDGLMRQIWTDGTQISVLEDGNFLSITQTPEALDRAAELLAELGEALRSPIEIEALAFEGGHAAVAALMDSGGFMSAAAFDALRGGKDQGLRVVASLAGSGMSGQRISISSARYTNVCGDYDVEVAQAASIPDPRVQQIMTGLTLSVRSTLLDDGRIALRLQADIVDDLKISAFAPGSPAIGKLQLPSVTVEKLTGSAVLAQGDALVVGAIAPDGGPRRLLAVRAHCRERRAGPVPVGELGRVFQTGFLTRAREGLPSIGLGISAGQRPIREEEDESDAIVFDRMQSFLGNDLLLDMIRNRVTPERWETEPGMSLRSLGDGRLLVLGGQEQHMGVRDLLSQLGATRARHANVAVYVVTAQRSALATLRAAGSESWLRQVMRSGETARRYTALSTSELGAPVDLLCGRETAYVDDYNVEIAQAATINDPIVESMFSGIYVRLLPFAAGRKGRLGLHYSITSAMADELASFDGGAVDVGNLQLAAASVQRSAGLVTVADKEYALLAEFSAPATPDEVVLVIAQAQAAGGR